ncbi:MAG: hypothetical protein JSV41_13795, partial [Gemmatimonadota bacterium]
MIAKSLIGPVVLGLLMGAGSPFVPAVVQDSTYLLRLSDRVGEVNRYRLDFDMHMRAEYRGTGEPDARTRQLMETLASGMGLRTAVEYEQELVEVARDG